MRRLLSLLALAFALPASAQTTSQEWFRPQVAFTWPQPFEHVPQTFEAQAVRFTNPGGFSPFVGRRVRPLVHIIAGRIQ